MDLRIKNNNATKSYVITNNCTTRPRVCMKSDTGVPATPISYLPLTTSTTQGLALRAKVNDQSYRALEFRSMSGSATFYSSNANGQGLSSTTALTRASTSRTEYLTQSSTSRTEYLTRSSTSATSYLTRSSTSGESYLTVYDTKFSGAILQTSSIQIWYSGDQWGTMKYRTDTYVYDVRYTFSAYSGPTRLTAGYNSTLPDYPSGTYSTLNIGNLTATSYATYSTIRSRVDAATYQNGTTSSTYGPVYAYSIEFQKYPSNYYTNYNRNVVFNSYVASTYSNAYATYGISDITMLYSLRSTRWDSNYDTLFVTNLAQIYRFTNTTGTSYLTRSSTYSTIYYTRSSTYDTVYYTRSSTYSTVYHTRSSTSGYSGVSSSSSETSGWQ